ncbi:MAG: crosslink repair DNA glycosylase YcaQ family protein, partial [Candidatus Hermodarchaeota archaeon]|nr:crosslink repair DNA glycosylase YcaQ family protein [Candidatus Hermodarchaeota archaeon]
MATEITQEQINGFRMNRHLLTSRATASELELLVEQVCGIQAQMPAAANLQLWARTENLKPSDIFDALWNSKTLIRTWCMRGTAHYLSSSQFPAYL